jgi:hypothetical protein
MWVLAIIFLFIVLFGPESCLQDNDYFPYFLNGLEVWVHDNDRDNDFHGGRMDTNYFNRKAGLVACKARAVSTARDKHLREWSYVCCTVTSSSSCETKVR